LANPSVLLDYCLYRPGDAYTVATTPIFTITGGPVIVKALFGVLTADEISGAATMEFLICGEAADSTSGSFVAGVIGDQAVSLLDGASAVLGPAPANPYTPLAAFMAGPGDIEVTVGTKQVDGIAFYVIYRRLTAAARIVLA
jgi:hypothetical protein